MIGFLFTPLTRVSWEGAFLIHMDSMLYSLIHDLGARGNEEPKRTTREDRNW